MKTAIYSIAFAASALMLFSIVVSGLFFVAVACCSLVLCAIVLDKLLGSKRRKSAACPNCPSTWK